MVEQNLNLFTKGCSVEVRGHEEGMGGAWYTATIRDPPQTNNSSTTSNNKIYVVYHRLLADDDPTTPLEEWVDLGLVRPAPPVSELVDLGLNEVVDAFYLDGWWTGVITRLANGKNTTFEVAFQNPPDLLELTHADMRVHHDWVNGEWVRPKKHEKNDKPDNHTLNSSRKKRGRPKSQICSLQASARGKTAKASETNCSGKQMKNANVEIISDDQPLSMWCQGMTSPPIYIGSSDTVGSLEASEIVLVENQNLPFVKKSPVWNVVETMELFQKMPQKPHFRALVSHKEIIREGLAIASMVDFANVIEKTSELQCHTHKSIIEDYLEKLIELENHGFDVKVVHDRLTELLPLKDKQEQLHRELNEFESKITGHNLEKTKIREDIEELDKKIRELEKERTLVMSKMEIKDSEIGSLELRVLEVKGMIKNVGIEFEGIASAPW